MNTTNLFVLCMNNSGSTLLEKYLSTSPNVVDLPETNGVATSSEGHNIAKGFMPHPRDHGVLGIWTEKKDVFRDKKLYNWQKIKEAWAAGWKSCAPLDGKILLEKSPPNPIRADLLDEEFSNPYFIAMMRNPYAVCEGIRRRLGYSVERSAEHWGKVGEVQIDNIKSIKNIIYLSYEDLCENQEESCRKINNFIPNINIQEFTGTFSGHHSILGKKEMEIVNLNNLQIKNLSKSDIKSINNILARYSKEMQFFNYKFM
jgi:hypothetical protein